MAFVVVVCVFYAEAMEWSGLLRDFVSSETLRRDERRRTSPWQILLCSSTESTIRMWEICLLLKHSRASLESVCMRQLRRREDRAEQPV